MKYKDFDKLMENLMIARDTSTLSEIRELNRKLAQIIKEEPEHYEKWNMLATIQARKQKNSK